MQHFNFVCFACRYKRRASERARPHCPHCRAPLVCVGVGPLPPLHTPKMWARWQEAISHQEASVLQAVEAAQLKKNRRLRALESIHAHRTGESLSAKRQYRRAEKAYRSEGGH